MIPCVPILWPRVGPWFIATSIEPGDSVLCICLAADYASWWVSRATEGATGLDRAMRGRVVPGDLRRHHLAHAVAIPMGMEHRHNALRNAPPVVDAQTDAGARLTIGSDLDAGTRLTFLGDGRVRVTQGNGTALEVTPDGDVHLAGSPSATKLLALAELVDARLSALRTAINTHTHPATSGTTSPTADGQVAALDSVAAAKTRGV